ncbi:thiamine diphosphokinase [Bacillus taeanensis]|uniref:Thiamine diphosphokinase n=1 Tax=Bacillus taeanensis TaxID=273032 RepID=A0A366XTN0_9BACI|nr:thiamine diphosphokinase [Bacillus taeanensis]RBW67513.1 thiamine diphosphokinase [Bacillus taeanensis]
MHIIILANGPEIDYHDLMPYKELNAVWVGVDRGVHYLLTKGITPRYAFGDFDSLTKEETEWLSSHSLDKQIYAPEKDQTDLEIAIDWAVAQKPEQITILGATGGRLDHALINIQLLLKGFQNNLKMSIVDKQNKLSMVGPGSYIINKENYFKYVSFISFSHSVEGLTLKGFKYPLENEQLSWGSSLCISNELVEEKGCYSFLNGILIMVKSRDHSNY